MENQSCDKNRGGVGLGKHNYAWLNFKMFPHFFSVALRFKVPLLNTWPKWATQGAPELEFAPSAQMFFLAPSHRESLIPFNKPLLSNYNVLSAYSIIKRSLAKAAFCLPQWGFQKICKMFPGLRVNIKEAGLQGAVSWQNVKGVLSLDSGPSPLRSQGLFLRTARKLPDIFY